jgi:hypothetical protein
MHVEPMAEISRTAVRFRPPPPTTRARRFSGPFFLPEIPAPRGVLARCAAGSRFPERPEFATCLARAVSFLCLACGSRYGPIGSIATLPHPSTSQFGAIIALMLAVIRCHVNVVRKLTDAGFSVSLCGTGSAEFSTMTALDLAMARGDLEMVEILRCAAEKLRT